MSRTDCCRPLDAVWPAAWVERREFPGISARRYQVQLTRFSTSRRITESAEACVLPIHDGWVAGKPAGCAMMRCLREPYKEAGSRM